MTLLAREGYKVIVGLGQTGYSCARYLQAQGYSFSVVDTRTNPPYLAKLKETMPNVPVYLGELQRDVLQKATELVISPGVDIQEQYEIRRAMRNGVAVIGDIELFCRAIADTPVVAITGSNGKSTVTTLVGEMAKTDGVNAVIGGNIGIPVLDLLEQGKKDLYVLELSSFQLETTESLRAEVATVLNISADHMDRYKNIAQYHQAKHRIFRGAKQVVVNRDDPLSEPLISEKVKKWTFGLDKPSANQFGLIEDQGDVFLAFGDQRLLRASELKIHGSHNHANALASLALGYAVGLTLDNMISALKVFPGLAHRCQFVAQIKQVSFYNDSKATNVGAAVAAIKGLGSSLKAPAKIVLIAGGYGKGAEFIGLLEPILVYARHVVLLGADAGKIENILAEKINTVRANSMQEAVELAQTLAQPGDAVLLAPACASFDMYENFEQRGDDFIKNVKSKVIH